MRLDASTYPGVPFYVFDVEQRTYLNDIVWVDDGIHSYCQARRPRVFDAKDPTLTRTNVIQVRRVEIHVDMQLVLVNPVEGFDWHAERETQERQDVANECWASNKRTST